MESVSRQAIKNITEIKRKKNDDIAHRQKFVEGPERTQAAFNGADHGRGAAGDAGVQLKPKDRGVRAAEVWGGNPKQLYNKH